LPGALTPAPKAVRPPPSAHAPAWSPPGPPRCRVPPVSTTHAHRPLAP